MKMNGFIITLLAGFVGCGYLIYRQRNCPAGPSTPVVPRPADELRPIDAWQKKNAPWGNFDWREKLRCEEARQRPQAGRN